MNYPQSILSDGSYRRLFIGGENVGNFAAATDLKLCNPELFGNPLAPFKNLITTET
jgi:hypothetical protein